MSVPRTRLEGDGLYLRPYERGDARPLLDAVLSNREFLAAYEPPRPDAYYTLEGQRHIVEIDAERWESGLRYAFGVFLPPGRIAGRVALDNVVLGAWHNATLGYYIDQDLNGQGLGTHAVDLVMEFAFERAGLHRVQAAVMPRNPASARLLEKLGFRREGRALRYLYIGDRWEDHDIYALTVEDRPASD